MSDETVPDRAAPGQAGPAPEQASPPTRGLEHPGTGGGTTGTRANGLGYEHARAELEDVVRRLEAGGTSLEESLALWERGEELARTCQELLAGARARLDAHRSQ